MLSASKVLEASALHSSTASARTDPYGDCIAQVPDQQPGLFWRVVGFLCDYKYGYVPPRRSLEIVSTPSVDDDDDDA